MGLRQAPLPLAELPELGDPAEAPGGRLVWECGDEDYNGRWWSLPTTARATSIRPAAGGIAGDHPIG